MQTISIVLPVYQNEANLPDTVPKMLSLRKSFPGYRLELVFVDDGSTDRSWELLCDFRERFPGTITLVRLSRNFGQNPAVQAGLRHATGDCVGIISADLQEPYETFREMVAHWEKGSKFIIGERVGRTDGRLKQWLGSLYWVPFRHFAWKDFPRMGYDFCLIDRQLIDDVNRIHEKNTVLYQLLYWLGYTPTRIPIVREKRSTGKSQWNALRKVHFYVDSMIAFTYLPVRIVTFLGLSTSVLATAYMGYVVVRWLFLGSTAQGWTSIVVLILCFGALTLSSLGIICEYLWRILDEARPRPPFVVDSVHRAKSDAGRSDDRMIPFSLQTEIPASP